MPVIHVTRRTIRTNPPIVTMVLILACMSIFILFQQNDRTHSTAAKTYYFNSGLAAVELPAYQTYLAADTSEKMSQDQAAALHRKLESDIGFLERLKHQDIIRPSEPGFEEWQFKRMRYEQIRARSASRTYGVMPSDFNHLTLVTSLFLHAGIWHLVCNMIFLWLAGGILESGCRKWTYLVMYLLAGVCAALSFKLVYPESTTSLIGSSGAVSGLIGAFTVLYGKDRIRIFTITFKGFTVFGIWIGIWLIQLVMGTDPRITFVAQAGGLLTGGVAALLLSCIPGATNQLPLKTAGSKGPTS